MTQARTDFRESNLRIHAAGLGIHVAESRHALLVAEAVDVGEARRARLRRRHAGARERAQEAPLHGHHDADAGDSSAEWNRRQMNQHTRNRRAHYPPRTTHARILSVLTSSGSPFIYPSLPSPPVCFCVCVCTTSIKRPPALCGCSTKMYGHTFQLYATLHNMEMYGYIHFNSMQRCTFVQKCMGHFCVESSARA